MGQKCQIRSRPVNLLIIEKLHEKRVQMDQNWSKWIISRSFQMKFTLLLTNQILTRLSFFLKIYSLIRPPTDLDKSSVSDAPSRDPGSQGDNTALTSPSVPNQFREDRRVKPRSLRWLNNRSLYIIFTFLNFWSKFKI